uniref:C2H2-type domain-containing protein n=1 Tax=Macrostomum lignano TaxID=282301 RepID=A0A1I8FH25_9PLAT
LEIVAAQSGTICSVLLAKQASPCQDKNAAPLWYPGVSRTGCLSGWPAGNAKSDVINVVEQRDFRMQLADFRHLVLSENRSRSGRLLNLLSLEISDSELGDMVQAPSNKENPVNADELQTSDQSEKDFDRSIESDQSCSNFCLLSPAGSYTDFPHRLWRLLGLVSRALGRESLLFVAANDGNLACYETWMLSSSSSTIFLGDRCARGHVFGGNFLHTYSLPMQIRSCTGSLQKLICDEFEAKKNNCGDSCSTASAYGSSKDDKDDDSKLAFKERRVIVPLSVRNRSRAEPSIQRYFLPTAAGPAQTAGSWAKHPTLPLVQKQRKQLKTSKRPASLSGSRGRSFSSEEAPAGSPANARSDAAPDLSAVEFQRMMSAFVQLQRLSGDQQADKASQLAAHLKFEAGPDSELVGSDGAGGACETTVVGEASAAGRCGLRDKAPRMAAEPISPKAVLTRKVRLLPMSEQQPQKQSFTRSLCMECGDRFTCVELLMMHHLQQHSRRVPSSACICPHCYLVLPTPDRILKHIAALHLRFTDSVGNSPIANGANRLADKGADSGAEYFCGICRKFFRHKTSLTRHNRNFHSGA